MENRFTAKDFFLFLLLGSVLLAIFLMMFQYDRMDQRVSGLKEQVEEYRTDVDHLGRTLRSINKTAIDLSRQAGAGTGTGGSIFAETELPPIFDRLLEIRERPDFAEGDTLMKSFGSRVEKVSPFTYSTANASTVQKWVLEPLCMYNPRTLEWEPFIARSWDEEAEPVIDEETGEQKIDEATGEPVNKYTYTFHLRDDVRFSDGRPVTAHDVEFSHNFIMDSRIAADRFRIARSRISAVEVIDDYTISFRFDEPYFRAFSIAAGTTIVPKHYYERFLENAEAAEEYNNATGHLIGTGPYTLEGQESWNPGERIRLNRNRRYWGAQPSFDRIVYHVITEDSVRRTKFENGEIDLYNARPADLQDLQRRFGDTKNFFQYLPPTAGYTYVGWKQYNYRDGRPHEPTVFANKLVRQAMTYLIDRDRIRRRVFRGLAIIADGPFHPALAQHHPELSPRERNVEKARQLLLEAGCSYRNDRLLKPNGEPFQFKLTYPSGSDDYQSMMNELQQSFGEVGIVMELDSTPFDVMIERMDERDFDAISLGWTSGFEIDIYQMFHSTRVNAKSVEDGETGENFIAYQNPELDLLIDRARSTMDEEERMKIWQETHRILYEDQPYTFLFRRQALVFTDNRIKNVEIMRHPETGEVLDRLNFAGDGVPLEWYVPSDQQRYK